VIYASQHLDWRRKTTLTSASQVAQPVGSRLSDDAVSNLQPDLFIGLNILSGFGSHLNRDKFNIEIAVAFFDYKA
jgi:hypothetical protein